MNKIVIEPKNKDELSSIEDFLKQNGIDFITEDEYENEKQKQKMQVFSNFIRQAPKIDISEAEINEIIDEVRVRRNNENHT